MPRLMTKDDVMRTAVDLGRAADVWSDTFDTESGEFSLSLPHGGSYQIVIMSVPASKGKDRPKKSIHYGLKREKLKNWNYEADQALDEEVRGMFECLKGEV